MIVNVPLLNFQNTFQVLTGNNNFLPQQPNLLSSHHVYGLKKKYWDTLQLQLVPCSAQADGGYDYGYFQYGSIAGRRHRERRKTVAAAGDGGVDSLILIQEREAKELSIPLAFIALDFTVIRVIFQPSLFLVYFIK